MTLKNARIYQELLRRLSPAEEKAPAYGRPDLLLQGMGGRACSPSGRARTRRAAGISRAWNR